MVVFPILWTIGLGFGFSYEKSFFSSLLSVVIINNVLITPLLINSIKEKFKKIGYNNVVNSWKLTFCIPTLMFSISMIQSVLMILLNFIIFSFWWNDSYIFASTSFSVFLSKIHFINWIEILFYLGYGAILGITFSFFINAFSLKKNIKLLIILIILLYSLLFAGVLPYQNFYSNPIFKAASMISPFKYIYLNGLITTSLNSGAFFFKMDILFNEIIFSNHLDTLFNFTVPFILISIFISLSSHHFRWFKNEDINNSFSEVMVMKKTKLTGFIIYFVFIGITTVMLLTGIVLLIKINHSKEISTYNTSYVIGSFLTVISIISYSTLAGLMIKDIYKNKVIFVNDRMMKCYYDK